MALFRVSEKVNSFHFKGKRYLPGEIVESSEEDAALFNLDFLQRVSEPKLEVEPESTPSAEVSVVDIVTPVAMLDPGVKVDALIVHSEAKGKVKPKILPKVQP